MGYDKGVVRVLLFSASLRGDSFNTGLIGLARSVVERLGARIDLATMQEFDAPSYNQDVEAQDGFPAGTSELHRRLEACHAFVIATPEYNASMPGHLKNAIDWVSRVRPQPFNARHGLLLSASPSMAGGNRRLWSPRIPLEHLGARIFPDMFSLAQAHKAFTDAGALADQLPPSGSSRTYARSWIWWKPPSTTPASRRPGWSSWASRGTRWDGWRRRSWR